MLTSKSSDVAWVFRAAQSKWFRFSHLAIPLCNVWKLGLDSNPHAEMSRNRSGIEGTSCSSGEFFDARQKSH